MVNNIKYGRFKRYILKYYKNQNVFIEIKGIVNTRIRIDNAKIIVNKQKLIIGNDNLDFEIELLYIEKLKIDDYLRMRLKYKEFEIILEV